MGQAYHDEDIVYSNNEKNLGLQVGLGLCCLHVFVELGVAHICACISINMHALVLIFLFGRLPIVNRYPGTQGGGGGGEGG